jgi:hypothetical protein
MHQSSFWELEPQDWTVQMLHEKDEWLLPTLGRSFFVHGCTLLSAELEGGAVPGILIPFPSPSLCAESFGTEVQGY